MKGPVEDDFPQPGTSADTIRRLPLRLNLRTDVPEASGPGSFSLPPSPRSSIPSPSSPSGDSVSSFPSVTSSFLISSGPGSPPHLAHHHEHDLEHDGRGDNSLIIPSLTLPSPLRRPTPYGQTLGEVRLIVLGSAGEDAASVANVFADEECDDMVEIGEWEDSSVNADTDSTHEEQHAPARVLRVSTDWIEHCDAHGLEKHEPTKNVEIVLLKDYELEDDPEEVIRNALAHIHSPFKQVFPLLHPDHPPSSILATLLASSATPLYTAMVLSVSHPLTSLEHTIITELSTHIPLIILPPIPRSPIPSHPYNIYPYTSENSRLPSLQTHGRTNQDNSPLGKARLASARPSSAYGLRTSLLRSPETLAALRLEAAERFLRWREVERAVGRVLGDMNHDSHIDRQYRPNRQNTAKAISSPKKRQSQQWDKCRWEAEWEGTLSTDVAKTLRARRGLDRRKTITPHFKSDNPFSRPRPGSLRRSAVIQRHKVTTDAPCPQSFDPLHLPSLLAFSLSLLAPLKSRVARAFGFRSRAAGDSKGVLESASVPGEGTQAQYAVMNNWALVGAFVAGLGAGIMLARM